ncbi:MAG: phospho-N-acetylmuramoyl-pentapeptide-transferase, partial [Firmicutes bacterium HGW-Firmicutes-13]
MRSHLYYAMLLTFLASLIVGPPVIYYLRRFKLGQHVRNDGPQRHLKKTGTPTLGGMIFLFSLLVISLFLAPRTLNYYLMIMVTVGNGAIGLADDLVKFIHKRPLGLKARNKLLGQVILAVILSIFLWGTGHSTVISFPLVDFSINLGPLYPFFVMFIIIGFSNAVNLTDGLDGLAAGTAVISLLAYFFIAFSMGLTDTAFFCAALAGACFGFLIYNLHPAKIF